MWGCYREVVCHRQSCSGWEVGALGFSPGFATGCVASDRDLPFPGPVSP